MPIAIHPVEGMPTVRAGDDLAQLICTAAAPLGLRQGDVLVVCQKIVSKAEGRVVRLADVTPSRFAEHLAAQTEGKDARAIEVILGQTNRVVKMDNGRLIVETGPGWVCANAGVDESNCDDADAVILLPDDPDASAQRIRAGIHERTGADVAVIVSDTFGRPFREGLLDVALGIAGMAGLLDLRGTHDRNGKPLHHTVVAEADALAAAAGLVMGKGASVPVALIRGYAVATGAGRGADLVRPRALDLFR